MADDSQGGYGGASRLCDFTDAAQAARAATERLKIDWRYPRLLREPSSDDPPSPSSPPVAPATSALPSAHDSCVRSIAQVPRPVASHFDLAISHSRSRLRTLCSLDSLASLLVLPAFLLVPLVCSSLAWRGFSPARRFVYSLASKPESSVGVLSLELGPHRMVERALDATRTATLSMPKRWPFCATAQADPNVGVNGRMHSRARTRGSSADRRSEGFEHGSEGRACAADNPSASLLAGLAQLGRSQAVDVHEQRVEPAQVSRLGQAGSAPGHLVLSREAGDGLEELARQFLHTSARSGSRWRTLTVIVSNSFSATSNASARRLGLRDRVMA